MSLVELIKEPRLEGLQSAIGFHLAQQQELTAVERFAQLHAAGEAQPAQARYYRDLIPLSAPASGEQYGFTVDLDACSGCKACVTACHSLNGLDDDETFREVGLLMGRDGRGQHVLQHVTTACHHCLEPACLHGCPTLAYDKDPVTGIVRHLDDQCIGCQYCTLMCPYDVPKYNPAKGIVRKCDMCRQRLDEGEAPACVQACPNQAIRIELVSREAILKRALANTFLPTAPDPHITLPATRFISAREQLHDVGPPDQTLRPAHPHLPLAAMLVLTQMSIGLFLFSPLVTGSGAVILAALLGLLGLAVSLLHLGRPQIAYRAWLGWRTSWMSREIIAFGIWTLVAGGYVATTVAASDISLRMLLWGLTAISGAVALACSAMVYVATRRAVWSARRTIPRFALSAATLGSATTIACQVLTQEPWSPQLLVMLAGATLWRLLLDAPRPGGPDFQEDLDRTSELLVGPLEHWHLSQVLLAILGGFLAPVLLLAFPSCAWLVVIPAAGLLVTSEMISRALFFAAASPPRMPGVIPS